ncbi:UDP-3-O-(3-hydroxymyristoyl)glucosamine N-acyltransferase [Aquabacter spiritensis]|uniref:UDP-3-O-acylglucosamine N-acyltransferase n=1 Tax=Aquabacter spiritensis TaxID=933073 RepID=A0A4R3LRG4_9HYPH|nr:UDP-3-O-(3-hydroxymyristoyl)glucosamine N-acyltransferase [Aquabacter spiritensis]TCT02891.1 UDP-3-O-[3-hydroxymyristoyl] glucosamine N-acyltransferase [Aquabacter spiritensis]
MTEPLFFPLPTALSLSDIVALSGARALTDLPEGDLLVRGVSTLVDAGPGDLAFFDTPRFRDDFRATRASVCITTPKLGAEAPAGVVVLASDRPAHAFAAVTRRLFPTALRPQPVFGHSGIAPGAFIHPTARLEDGVTVDPGAVIGPGVEIGADTVICANAVIGPSVRIGRDSAVGPGVSLLHALVGNRVILHAGVRIGQDGFGYQPSPRGHLKVPQIGRVVLQDDVEVGAGTSIDRGALRDTVIGEGTKIDNLVQIAHNVAVGRHCIIVSQTGISGSATLGDFVMLGGQVGVLGHITIGDGAQIAATSNVKDDVPPGVRWGGSPAKPVREWFREISTLKRLAEAGAHRQGEG